MRRRCLPHVCCCFWLVYLYFCKPANYRRVWCYASARLFLKSGILLNLFFFLIRTGRLCACWRSLPDCCRWCFVLFFLHIIRCLWWCKDSRLKCSEHHRRHPVRANSQKYFDSTWRKRINFWQCLFVDFLELLCARTVLQCFRFKCPYCHSAGTRLARCHWRISRCSGWFKKKKKMFRRIF